MGINSGRGDIMKYNHWLPKLLTKLSPNSTINAIVLFKTVLFREKKENISERLIKHEKKHIEQQEEFGLKFYYLYLKEYINNRLDGMSHRKAYLNISFEIEARNAENT